MKKAGKGSKFDRLEGKKSAAGSGSRAPVYEIKSFTPYKEEPFCGHGVVGAMIALGDAGRAAGDVVFYTVDGIMVQAQLGTPLVGRPGDVTVGERWTVKLQIPSVPVTEDLNLDEDLRARIASSLKLQARQIVSMGRNSLKDLVIELDDSVDFSASRMTIDGVALMEASPPGTRSQVLTGDGSRYGVDFVKRVFAYGSEGEFDVVLGARDIMPTLDFRSSHGVHSLRSHPLLGFEVGQVKVERQADFRKDRRGDCRSSCPRHWHGCVACPRGQGHGGENGGTWGRMG